MAARPRAATARADHRAADAREGRPLAIRLNGAG